MQFTLQPGQIQQVALSGKYLVARTVTAAVVIYDPETRLSETVIRQSDTITLDGQRSIYVKNVDNVPADIELQSSLLEIRTSDSGAVSVTGGYLSGITNPVPVNVQGGIAVEAEVKDGSMLIVSPAYTASTDIVIQPGQTAAVVPAGTAGRHRTIWLQNTSADDTVLRVGPDAGPASGLLLIGSVDNVSTLEISTVSALSAHNASDAPARVSVMVGAV